MRPRLEPDWAEAVARAIQRKAKRDKRTPHHLRMIRNHKRRKDLSKRLLAMSEQTSAPTTQARRPRKGLA